MSKLNAYLEAKREYEELKQKAKGSNHDITTLVDRAYDKYIEAKQALTNAGWAPM